MNKMLSYKSVNGNFALIEDTSNIQYNITKTINLRCKLLLKS